MISAVVEGQRHRGQRQAELRFGFRDDDLVTTFLTEGSAPPFIIGDESSFFHKKTILELPPK